MYSVASMFTVYLLHIRSMEVLTKCTQQKETADFLKVLLEVFGKLKL